MKITLLLAFFALNATAAVRCVGPTATGNGTGVDWDNKLAWTATPARGDVWYLEDGLYPSKTFSTALSGSTVITIKKATAADHGPSIGWVSGMGDGQAVINSMLTFTTGNWILDGQRRNEANWFDGSAYGIRIAANGLNNQIRVSDVAVDNLQFRYLHIEALDTDLPGTTVARYSLYLYDSQAWSSAGNNAHYPNRFTGYVIHRSFLDHGNVPIFIRQADGMVVEYSAFSDSDSNDANHGEAISAYFGCNDFVFRYNKFRNVRGTACMAFTGNGWQMYGNVFYRGETGNGVVAGFGGGAMCNNNKFHHNTIIAGTGYNDGLYYAEGSTGNEAYNNIWVNSRTLYIMGGHDYNAFWDGSNRGEANAQLNVPTSIFVDYANDNFMLKTATMAGRTLGSPYNVDMLGVARGSGGVIDRGSYEFGGVVTNPPPTNPPAALIAPTGFRLGTNIADFRTVRSVATTGAVPAPTPTNTVTCATMWNTYPGATNYWLSAVAPNGVSKTNTLTGRTNYFVTTGLTPGVPYTLTLRAWVTNRLSDGTNLPWLQQTIQKYIPQVTRNGVMVNAGPAVASSTNGYGTTELFRLKIETEPR